MTRITRRELLKAATAGGMAVAASSLAPFGSQVCKAAGPNAEIRVAVIGLGGIGVGVGGRGRELVNNFQATPGVRVTTICDVDQAILDYEVSQFKKRGEKVVTHTDLRKVFDDKNIDAVAIATPDQWHALATIWACQAGKDVYVEKPCSHNIWEGRQLVAAARKYGRIVQVGTQRRSSPILQEAVAYAQSGAVGAVRCVSGLNYRPRPPIGKVTKPTPIPPTVDYNLWCGPVPMLPLMRKQLHYDWHWLWATGSGEMGNIGSHMIDVARWVLGVDKPAPRVISLGGRFGIPDDGETANVQLAYFDYRPAPIICEIRNYQAKKDTDTMGRLRGIDIGVVIDCEGGYVAGDFIGAAAFDKQGKKIKAFPEDGKKRDQEVPHVANFIEAVRSRNSATLKADALVGHMSATCCHMANISYRLGKRMPPEAIFEATRANTDMADAVERCRDYLRQNGVDLHNRQAILGPWLTLDAEKERFVGQFADQANRFCRHADRAPFVVPEIV